MSKILTAVRAKPARNRLLVTNDWLKSKLFGRDVSRE